MYKYEEAKPRIFTEEGQRMFLAIRDNVNALIKKAGAVRMQEAMHAGCTGSTWDMIACVDRLVELGEIREITNGPVCGQYRVFVSAKGDA